MPDQRPYRIGITGNIACGKSVVSSMLEELGAEIIDADLVAHEVMAPGGQVIREIEAEFGSQIINADGSLNRPALGEIVFSDPAALAKLEEMTHPPTVQEILRRADESTAIAVVIDAIKLYESGLAEHCDETWAVICDPEVQRERLMNRNVLSIDEAQRRINAQPPQDEKMARADVLIDNSGDLESTRRQVLEAWSLSHGT